MAELFNRILIANRGEIACRVMRTCRELGIETVAVYSDADAGAQHVLMADQAVHLGGNRPQDSYLSIERVMAAAKQSGAEAIHPGYGFLSENTALVRACKDQGLVFIGPDIDAVDKMGSKADAKSIMEAAGVPLVPGYHGEEQDLKRLQQEADKVGFPLMIKAAAGGGGKGMRIVRNADDFEASLNAAKREAMNAFSDDKVILERYLEKPRHIEFQVFGDNDGQIIHLFERECSVQRRYQKVLEESPSPFLTEETRGAMGEQAVAAARAVNYRGAGTVEFIVDTDGSFFFMEMNTRLQVEHPVTECVTGLDLVEWQIRVAAGEPLPLAQDQISRNGHAIEARVYAENPEQGFLPSSGQLKRLRFPEQSAGLRVDSGVVEGDTITVHYDPMIAKVIAYGSSRQQAITRLAKALSQTHLVGPASNIPFLYLLLHQAEVTSGEMYTNWLDASVEKLVAPPEEVPQSVLVAAALLRLIEEERSRSASPDDPHSPWSIADAWRPGHPGRRVIEFVCNEHIIDIAARGYAGDYDLSWNGHQVAVRHGRLDTEVVSFEVQGHRTKLTATKLDERVFIAHEGRIWILGSKDPFAFSGAGAASDDDLVAPMPGRVVSVNVSEGDTVSTGDELLVLEAMKMEISLKAPHDGNVETVAHGEGDFVEADTLLVTVKPK